jgi:hypothetical protein
VLSLLLSPAENMVTAARLSNAQAPLDSERQILKRMEGPLIRTKVLELPSFLDYELQTSRYCSVDPSKVQLELESVQPARGGARTSRTSDGISEKYVNVRCSTDLSLSKRFKVIPMTHNFNTLSHADPYPS